jgi:hypothetical protein
MQHRKGVSLMSFHDQHFDDYAANYHTYPDPISEKIKQNVQRDMQVERKETTEEEEAKYFLQSLHSDHAYAEAKKEGNVIVLPEENQLLLDIDSPEAEVMFNKNRPRFVTHIAEIIKEERKTSRGGNTHIYVTLGRNVDECERVLFQLFLGSDQKRELLSHVRILNEDPHPTLFIEKPTLLLGDGQ